MTPYTIVRERYYLIFLFFCSSLMLLVFSITSCSGNEKKEQDDNTVVDDSVQAVKSIASEDSAIVFNNDAERWLGASIRQQSFDWSRFHLEEFWSDDSLQRNAFEPKQEFYKDYAQVLRWSPDSSYILDLGSYGGVKVKDSAGNTRIEGGEPDTEVSMIYPRQKQKERLLFFGPGITVVDGRWLDPSQVAVLALYDQNGDHHTDTLLWIINARERFFRKYKWE